MAASKPLRVATEDDAPRTPMTILEAAEQGSELDQLMAMRRKIAGALDSDNTLARDLASLSKRMMEISKEIEELRAAESERARDAEIDSGNISTAWRPEAI